MKLDEIVGLLGVLFSIFIFFGFIVKTDPISLMILIVIGGLFFYSVYSKNNYAIFGSIVLISSLLFYLLYAKTGTLELSLSKNYLAGILTIIIILSGFIIAQKYSS
ncbi:MAG: hypothetical protein B6U88_02370 [Candidatus Aenigmarchaeota archaeon ex4484_56]|nr:MAG: hypothetical protein B6U88_02370 [Candidatus Aenigmarchaeota archaeon ex4484_56]